MTNNDLEMTIQEREIRKHAQALSSTIRNESLDAIITRAAKIEAAARELGWRATALHNLKNPLKVYLGEGAGVSSSEPGSRS